MFDENVYRHSLSYSSSRASLLLALYSDDIVKASQENKEIQLNKQHIVNLALQGGARMELSLGAY